MQKLNYKFQMLIFALAFFPVYAWSQDNSDFKVTLTINETGDQCVWGGGTEGNGDVVVTGRTGPKKIQVKLENNKGSMECKAFSGEGASQMTCSGGDKTINIRNANTGLADVRYDIWTTIDGRVVPCEPKIINR
jgi:uncharacterized protein YodC (DUF2158 family)